MREKGRAAIYGMAGIYLLFLTYNMFEGRSDSAGSEYILVIVFTILFLILGLGMLGLGFYMIHMIYKKSKDTDHQEETEHNENEDHSTHKN